MLRSTFF
ncbi:unnamed protein product [Gordionus sp. m RMFG-2023]